MRLDELSMFESALVEQGIDTVCLTTWIAAHGEFFGTLDLNPQDYVFNRESNVE
jgi:hypothetical protein